MCLHVFSIVFDCLLVVFDSKILRSVDYLNYINYCYDIRFGIQKYNWNDKQTQLKYNVPNNQDFAVEVEVEVTAAANINETNNNNKCMNSHNFILSNFLNLDLFARNIANKHKYIYLILATNGYKTMLHNFLFHASKFSSYHSILIITTDNEIYQLGNLMNISTYIYTTSTVTTMPKSVVNNETMNNSYDFGTILYQKLILFRTKIALKLLKLGYNPIIADIDTIWLDDPMTTILKQSNSDILITNDENEVCGCFIVLNNTINTINFWSNVTFMHQKLIENALLTSNSHLNSTENSNSMNNSNNLKKFSDSEQKILTNLIYNNSYNGNIFIKILNNENFPSGLQFFNYKQGLLKLQLQDTNGHTDSNNRPVIIHNNFLISNSMKINRFQRSNLWNIESFYSFNKFIKQFELNSFEYFNNKHPDKPSDKPSDKHSDKHSYTMEDPLQSFKHIFRNISKNYTIPSLNIVLPIHNTILSKKSYKILTQISIENLLFHSNLTSTSSSTLHSNSNQISKLYMKSNPPQYLTYRTFAIYDIALNSLEPLINIRTKFHENDEFGISIQAIVENNQKIDNLNESERESEIENENENNNYNNTYFALDRSDMGHEIAHNKVLQYRLLNHRNNPENNYQTNIQSNNPTNNQTKKKNDKSFKINYLIKVLTYNRPDSLKRLLDSLVNAYYNNYTINIEILIDGPKLLNENNENEIKLIELTKKISADFVWLYGTKIITIRKNNIGLANQWFHAWNPNLINRTNNQNSNETHNTQETDEHEAAFIFEDDIEVSKYYFQWTFERIDKYYSKQFDWHQLLDIAMNSFIQSNGTKDSLKQFILQNSGNPIFYGICLQKQHLNPINYPINLEINNGNQPFLYSLIGSWGPLLLPGPWLIFKKWINYLKLTYNNQNNNQNMKITDLFVGNLITNSYLTNNPTIWTPWIIKFGYETGLKCLYSNFPQNLSLITNYREIGENYQQKIGSSSELITDVIIHNDLLWNNHMNIQSSLQSAMHYIPEMNQLALYQYDYHIRRAGNFVTEKLFDKIFTLPNIQKHENNDINEYQYDSWMKYLEIINNNMKNIQIIYENNVIIKKSYELLNNELYLNGLDLIESILLPTSTIIHYEVTPWYDLLQYYDLKHQIYSINNCNYLQKYINLNNNDCIHFKDLNESNQSNELKYNPSLLIINFFQITNDIAINHQFLSFPMVEYLLLYGPCASAPTVIEFRTRNNQILFGNNDFNENQMKNENKIESETYMVIEDICLEGDNDLGLVLFK